MSNGAEAAKKILKWRRQPELFFKEVLGINTLEFYQIKLLNAVAQNKRVAVRACHSVGKTWSMARVVLWFYACYENSVIITTAPTFKQVETILWGELREAHNKSAYSIGGNLTRVRLEKSAKHYAFGFSPQKSAGSSEEQQGSSFQGFHSDYVMIIFDEATGITADIWKMADGLMTSGKLVKFVAIGNPTTRACEFFNCFNSARYKKIHLSCFNSPNMIANDFRTMRSVEREILRLQVLPEDERLKEIQDYSNPVPHLLSASWLIDYVMEWGIDHPLVASKAFGNFPDDDADTLIKLSYVNEAIERDIPLDMVELRCIGIDVARFGDDKSVLIEMVGKKQTDLSVGVKQSTTVISGLAVQMINNERKNTNTVVLVDATGIGSGVYDNLVEAQKNGDIDRKVELVEIHFGASAANKNETDKEKAEQDKARFYNLKSRMFHLLAADLKSGLDIFNDLNYLKELPTIKAEPDSRGKLRIESKDDYRKRTGRKSPDFSDALALCNYGRYVNMGFGSFTKQKDIKPLVKQERPKKRRSGIRSREY